MTHKQISLAGIGESIGDGASFCTNAVLDFSIRGSFNKLKEKRKQRKIARIRKNLAELESLRELIREDDDPTRPA